MVRERTPARSYPHANATGSWVLDGHDGDDEETPSPDDIRRRRDAANRSPTKASMEEKAAASISYASSPSHRSRSTYLNQAYISDESIRSKRYANDGGVLRRSNITSDTAQKYDFVQDALQNVLFLLRPILVYICDILGKTLQALKTPISYILAIWIVLGVLVVLRNLVFTSLHVALSPVCRLPGVSFLNLPICHGHLQDRAYRDSSSSDGDLGTGDLSETSRFDQLMQVQSRFEEVLEQSAGGASLPLDMKRGETSVRDLRQVVRFSQLPSKDELVHEFDGFIETAKAASYNLQKFNSHVGRGVDHILATAKWTKRVLDGIAETDAPKGSISSFFSNTVLALFQPVSGTERTLTNQYIQHTQIVEGEIKSLVTEAQALLGQLQNLEDRLYVIHGISVRDDLQTKGSRHEVLSQLYTVLGGNRDKLGNYESQLQLLSQVSMYRQTAIAHISGTLIKLQGMGAELEELRERVAGVELLRDESSMSLKMHIENIEMGVERLEKTRKGAKQLEDEQIARALNPPPPQARLLDKR